MMFDRHWTKKLGAALAAMPIWACTAIPREFESGPDSGVARVAQDDGGASSMGDVPPRDASTTGSDPSDEEDDDDGSGEENPGQAGADDDVSDDDDANDANEDENVSDDDVADEVDPSDVDAGPTTPEGLDLGEPCEQSNECASSSCVDGVCCASACSEVCSVCNAPGSEGECTETLHDPACGAPECQENTECRSYELSDDANCAALGQCAEAPACTATDALVDTSCQEGTGLCDGEGQCIVPDKKNLGETCSTADECGSGVCAATASGARVCCAQACDGACQACGTDGFCDAFPLDDERCPVITCSADTTCSDYPLPLDGNRCAGVGRCISMAEYCVATFADTSTSCGTGRFCDGAGACENACTANELWCTESCIDPNTNDEHCDGCDQACPSGTSCVAGSCECPGNGEQLCSGSCIDTDSDPSNCGDCGDSCPAPTQTGSTRTCTNGVCGVCGAYSESCCSGGSCGSGLVCGSGLCQCQVGTHHCSSGHAAGSCATDSDTTACGTTCVDCTQPNAIAACVGGSCANSCPGGIATLCAGTGGKPSCGAWNFESNSVEGWRYDDAISGERHAGDSAPTVGNEARYGSYSLAIRYDSTDVPSLGRVLVEVPLCSTGQPIDLRGLTLSAYLRFVEDPGSPPLSDLEPFNGALLNVYLKSGDDTLGGSRLGFMVNTNTGGDATAGSWYHKTEDLESGFVYFPELVEAATHVGFQLMVHPWRGTIYIDRVEIQ